MLWYLLKKITSKLSENRKRHENNPKKKKGKKQKKKKNSNAYSVRGDGTRGDKSTKGGEAEGAMAPAPRRRYRRRRRRRMGGQSGHESNSEEGTVNQKPRIVIANPNASYIISRVLHVTKTFSLNGSTRFLMDSDPKD